MSSDFNIFPLLQKKYQRILALLIMLIIVMPWYFTGFELWYAYIAPAFLALATFALRQKFFFQKFHRKLRPFIVARALQIAAAASGLFLIAATFPAARSQGAWLRYGILWLLACVIIYQYFGIFRLAKKAKKDHPERCDFC